MNNAKSQTSGLVGPIGLRSPAHWASEAFAKRCLNDLFNKRSEPITFLYGWVRSPIWTHNYRLFQEMFTTQIHTDCISSNSLQLLFDKRR